MVLRVSTEMNMIFVDFSEEMVMVQKEINKDSTIFHFHTDYGIL